MDPKAGKYGWQTPYAYFRNSPIFKIDYNGLGDYYTKGGKHVGSDNKKVKNKQGEMVPDNKAYIAYERIKHKDGSVSFTNAKELSVSNSTLNKYANTVAVESSGNKEESYGIASAISNLAKYKGKDILSTLQSEGIYGYGNGGNNSSYKNNAESSMGAALNALTGGHDYSNGAIRWDGDDIGRKGFKQYKPRVYGVQISQKFFDMYKTAYLNVHSKNFSSNFSSGIHKATAANVGRVLLKAVAVQGRTIFWAPNIDPVIIYPPIIRDIRGVNKTLIVHPNAGYNFDANGL